MLCCACYKKWWDEGFLCPTYHFNVKAICRFMKQFFYSFDLSCPILKNNNFIEHFYIVLSCLVLLDSILSLTFINRNSLLF